MTIRNDRDLEKLLADDAGELGALYRKLPRLEPARRLDRNVLAEASRAVHGRPRGTRWLLGAGTAAGVLLAAGIAWRVNVDLSQQREAATVSAPPASTTAPATSAAEVISVQAHGAASGRAALTPLQSKGFDGDDNVVATGSRIAAESEQRATVPVESKKSELQKSTPAANSTMAAQRPAAEVRARRAPMADAPNPRTESAMPADSFPANAAPPPPPPPQAAPVATMEPAPAADAFMAAPKAAASRASAVAPAAVDHSAQPSALSMEVEQAKQSLPVATSSGDAAIAQIRALLKAGRRDAALAILRDLRREQPTVAIPDDLRDLER